MTQSRLALRQRVELLKIGVEHKHPRQLAGDFRLLALTKPPGRLDLNFVCTAAQRECHHATRGQALDPCQRMALIVPYIRCELVPSVRVHHRMEVKRGTRWQPHLY